MILCCFLGKNSQACVVLSSLKSGVFDLNGCGGTKWMKGLSELPAELASMRCVCFNFPSILCLVQKMAHWGTTVLAHFPFTNRVS